MQRTFFEDRARKVRLAYPPGWAARPSPAYVLLLSPESNEPPGLSISLDIPDLPPHIPGLIPMGLVARGYVDDLKKSWPTLRVEEAAEQPLAGAQARRIRSSWQANDRTYIELALLTAHGDRVFILRADADADDFPRIRPAFEALAASLEWLK